MESFHLINPSQHTTITIYPPYHLSQHRTSGEMEKDFVYFELDQYHLAQKITELIKKGTLPFNVDPQLRLSQPLQYLSYQIINALVDDEYHLLPSYRFYERDIEGRQKKFRVKNLQSDKADRIHYQVHVVVCTLLAKIYGLSETIKRKAIEDFNQNKLMKKLLCGRAEITRNLKVDAEDSCRDYLEEILIRYVKMYEFVEHDSSQVDRSNLFASEEEIEHVTTKIKSIKIEDLSSIANESLSGIKLLTQLGYIAKQGEARLRKSRIDEETAQRCANDFAQKANLIVCPTISPAVPPILSPVPPILSAVSPVLSKENWSLIHEKIMTLEKYLKKQDLSFEERNALKPYQDHLQQQAKKFIFNEKKHHRRAIEHN
ncbi:MAG: hypothetical protein R3E91_03215 [Chlamydiales bacterium]